MTSVRDEPEHALVAAVRSMWIAEAGLRGLGTVGGALVVGSAIDGVLPWLALASIAIVLVYLALVPRLRHERWRWSLREEELDLRHGVWRVTRTIVPITRIQHVSVERTGWTNFFGLVLLHVHTAAGKTTIPGLERATADELRDRILARLRTPDDL